MVSGSDLARSKTAISDGLSAMVNWEESEPVDPEFIQIQLLTAILTELVAAREDRAARRAGPNIKIGG